MGPTQIPIFPSSNFDETVRFYALIGFAQTGRFGAHYLTMKHEGVGLELHFYGARRVRSRSNDHAAYVRFASADEAAALYDQWRRICRTPEFSAVAGKAGRLVEMTDTDYGLREFALLDFDGNLLRVGGTVGADVDGEADDATLVYRSATLADTEQIGRLWKAAGLGGDDGYNHHEIAFRLATDDGLFIVGVDPGDRGTLRAVAMGCNDNHRGWVKRVAVAPELRGRGIGRELVGELERRFIASGIEQLRLSLYEHNLRGAAFWESVGFVELPDIRYFAKDLRREKAEQSVE